MWTRQPQRSSARGDDLVDLTVLGDQHERRIRPEARRASGIMVGMRGTRVDRNRLRELQLEAERAAVSRLTFCVDRAAHHLNELAGDRETQPGAAIDARR